MSYPRKRALLACDFCRQRKRRCDGKKPVCGNCAEASADCRYQELPLQRLDPSPSSASMAKRLERIEELLKSHTEAIAALNQASATTASPRPDLSGVTPAGPMQPPDAYADGLHATSPSDSRHSRPSVAAPSPSFQDANTDLPPFTIPPKHQTTTNSLLALPTVKSLVGEFPEDYFFRIESQRAAPGGLHHGRPEMPYLNRDVTDLLVTTFFATVHPCHPILAREDIFTIYKNSLTNGPSLDLESALCLIILALGVVASQPVGNNARSSDWAPGLEYFQPALQILLSQSAFSFSPSLILPQALIFAGVYFAYLTQPLHSWKCIHSASTHLQLLLSRLDNTTDAAYKERVLQSCWSCFLIECDRLAEFNLPRSGIETLVDEMSFPKAGNPPDPEKLCYLAEISIRRLLNRIHNSIYNAAEKGSPLSMPVSSLIAISSELDRQLLLWYDSVPEIIKPSLGLEPTIDDRQRLLRIRYYATRHIIYRLFVLYVVSLPEGQEPWPMILDRAQICIESCRYYLQNTGEILKKPSQYTWTLSQSSLGAVLVLTVASLSPYLKHLVPDILQLQQLVIDNVSTWAVPDSSFESVIWILGDISRKQRFR